MVLLKNRKIAILITVIVVFLSMLFGVGRSLNRLAANTERMFYEGVYLEDRGFVQPAINAHLENITNLALDCATVFANHPDLAHFSEAVRFARRDLLEANSISDKFGAYLGIREVFIAFFNAADAVELYDGDRSLIDGFAHTFFGAVNAIESSAYNDMAVGFMGGVSGFAQLLRPIVSVTPPQTFG